MASELCHMIQDVHLNDEDSIGKTDDPSKRVYDDDDLLEDEDEYEFEFDDDDIIKPEEDSDAEIEALAQMYISGILPSKPKTNTVFDIKLSYRTEEERKMLEEYQPFPIELLSESDLPGEDFSLPNFSVEEFSLADI